MLLSVLVVDQKTIAAVIGALALVAGVAGGFWRLSTPKEEECIAALGTVREELADKSARLELTIKAADACAAALSLSPGGQNDLP